MSSLPPIGYRGANRTQETAGGILFLGISFTEQYRLRETGAFV